ncbi:hypothetical protein SUGI_1148780 [Cryptomeria japonica]|uniref:protein NODULATION SIGNALING PATHWAY 2-like n=1 Tax=Cryptomeria japonica TaxID=3369 RepID=UPI002414A275|nr:protein NODULATION SIGNALING PATHWAY 2-like [Cryptomeria japonica]GLJ53818.1 hypothetical protein SUGI_1148780 [Cryptomeria japonica]
MDTMERWVDFPSQLFCVEDVHSKSISKLWDQIPLPYAGSRSKEASRTASAGSDLSYEAEMDVATESFLPAYVREDERYEMCGEFSDHRYFNPFPSDFSFMDFTKTQAYTNERLIEPEVDDQNPNLGWLPTEKSLPLSPEKKTHAPKSEGSVLSAVCSSQTNGDPPSNSGLILPPMSGKPTLEARNVDLMDQDSDWCTEFTIPAVYPEPEEEEKSSNMKGVRLVHLLMAAAEAVEARNRDLASVILVRLKALASPFANNTMERLAAYLSHGLYARLEGGRGAGLFPSASPDCSPGDILASFQVLQEICPYIKFGHLTANQAILEAVQRERRVHIIDFDIMEGIQWPSLMQALATRKEGAPHLRITAITRSSTGTRRGLSTVQETGKRLGAFAASIGLPFSFHQTRLDSDDMFRPSAIRVVKGEALAVNCMLHLPHMTHRKPNSISSFLLGIRDLYPRILTLVQEHLNCKDPDSVPPSASSYTAHFMETFHHYSAIFDSVEASFPPQSVARSLVERIFFGPRISSTLASKHCSDINQRSWSEFITSQLGFKSSPLSMFNQCQAKLLLGLFNDGYRIEEENGNLVLGWKSRPIISVSCWVPVQG